MTEAQPRWLAGRLFSVLLAIFPRTFREAFGPEMREVFEAQLRDAHARGRSAVAGVWLRTLTGMPASAWRERRSARQRRAHGLPLLETLAADVRLAGRLLVRAPMFSAVVVTTIAIGVGGVATIFSALNAVILRPLPGTTDGAQLVGIERRTADLGQGVSASRAFYRYLSTASRSLHGTAAWSRVALSIARGNQSHAVAGNIVSGNYFAVLGVRPAAGRFFVPDEDTVPLGHPVIVVSYAYWTTELGRDPSAVGSPVTVNGQTYRLIGVAPEGFRGVFTPIKIDAWVPLAMQPHVRPGRDLQETPWLWVFGRLAPGVQPAQARAELSTLAKQWTESPDESSAFRTYTSVRLTPLTGLPQDARQALLGFAAVLLGAAVLVLIIAGANVSSLLAARAVARRREIGVRVALGASRGRLVRQLLTETLALFVLGAIGGTLIAVAATAALERVPVPTDGALSLELSPDFRVLALSIAVSLIAGIAFGAGPALRGVGRNPGALLRATSAGAGRRTRAAQALIVAQVACSLVLLTAAALFARSLVAGTSMDPKLDPTGVAVATFNTEAYGYSEASGNAFYTSLRRRLEADPAVEQVSYSTMVPLTFADSGSTVTLDGRTTNGGPAAKLVVKVAQIDEGYLSAVRIRLLEGRDFRATDASGAPVAIVNERFARRAWPDGDPVGRTFTMNGRRTEVIAVARDSRYASLDEGAVSFAYSPIAQQWQNTRTVFVRGRGGETPPASLIESAVAAIDPAIPRPAVSTLRREMRVALLPQRVAALVTGILGGVGLLLAAVGLYGLVAYAVSLRRREIGVRMALGASGAAVARLVVTDGLRLIAAGAVTGVIASLLVTRLLQTYLLTVSPVDPVAFAGAATLLALVTVAASAIPARRAAVANPIIALRAE